ncbi:MAG TPA: hypothetical protein VFC61_01815 [Blastocatellia bacterium]|nr:hypothetical protein [Blastocatellia bacterium]
MGHRTLSTTLHRLCGLTCMAGGLSWFATGLLEASGTESRWRPTVGGPVFALTVICLMGGPLGLLALRAAGGAWKRRGALAGAGVALLGLCSYAAGVVRVFAVGGEDGLVLASRALGALLVGVGMIALGVATFAARRLPGWRRFAPLLVGLYYAVMIPFQIVFFIRPTGCPSVTLLAFWGLAWALLGYAMWSADRTPEAGQHGSAADGDVRNPQVPSRPVAPRTGGGRAAGAGAVTLMIDSFATGVRGHRRTADHPAPCGGATDTTYVGMTKRNYEDGNNQTDGINARLNRFGETIGARRTLRPFADWRDAGARDEVD